MKTRKRDQLPKDLARGRSQFQAWRATRQAGSRIPQTLWTLVVRLVKTHDVSRIASALGLDYYCLKKKGSNKRLTNRNRAALPSSSCPRRS